MSDLISRSALIKKFEDDGLGDYSLLESVFAAGVYAGIENAPTIDAVEVVRCRECQYCSTFRMAGIDYPLCMIADKVKTHDGFCDEGVKRDAKED